jgi:DNA adenine methylase
MPKGRSLAEPKMPAATPPARKRVSTRMTPAAAAEAVAPQPGVRPLVKWAGGKSRLLGELLPRIPHDTKRYFEPFFGGGALFFALAASAPRSVRRAVLADQNDDLIATYRALRDDVDALVRELRKYRYDEKLFYAVRGRDLQGASDTERAARLIFLNHTCFNGLWRVNSKGQFNVPFGRYTNPTICNEPLLRRLAPLLKDVDLHVADFAVVTRKAKRGDFVYFDPPYMPVSKTANFASYATGGFVLADHQRLQQEFTRLAGIGVNAMLSNADTPDTRALYKDFSCFLVRTSRRINSNIARRGDASELIVTNWGKAGLWDSAEVEWSPELAGEARQAT